jgi:hypothetical protein
MMIESLCDLAAPFGSPHLPHPVMKRPDVVVPQRKRLEKDVAYAELDGKPFSGVKTSIRFRDRE